MAATPRCAASTKPLVWPYEAVNGVLMFSLTGAAWTAILPQMVRTLAERAGKK